MPEHHLSQIQDVAMTAQERELLRHRLRAYTMSHAPRRSVPLQAWRWATRHGVFALGLTALVLTAGTGVSASWAQPGDTLYTFRLSVNDRIETAIVFDDEAQIDVQMQQMQRMIDDEDAAVSAQLESLRDDAEVDSVSAAEDDFEAELEDIERDVRNEQSEVDDISEREEEEIETPHASGTPTSTEDAQLEQELRDISRQLEDEEERSGQELE